MKVIKVIDLLNKIVNEEVVPKIILYKGVKYCKNKWNDTYYKFGCSECDTLNIDTYDLNNIVEIIEEPQKHKIPEKINDILRIDDLIPPVDENMYKIWKQTIKNHNKINEIIDYLEEENE